MQISLHRTHATRPSLETRRVVIIDDDAEVADSIAEALRATGCDVQVAYDSADGIDASAIRSLAGKKLSTSNTPTLSKGGFCTCPISPARSGLCPARQAACRKNRSI